MEPGSPAADLPLLALTVYRPVGQAVVRLGWRLPSFRAPEHEALIAIHQGAQYSHREARQIANTTGSIMPSSHAAPVGVVGVGRWTGTKLVDVEPIEPVFAKGNPGLWRLSAADEQTVRERYAAALAKRQGRPISGGSDFNWSEQ